MNDENLNLDQGEIIDRWIGVQAFIKENRDVTFPSSVILLGQCMTGQCNIVRDGKDRNTW